MNRFNNTAKKFDIKINVKKTKSIVSIDGRGLVNIVIDGQTMKQFTNFKYLGSFISADVRSFINVKSGEALAKEAFSKRKDCCSQKWWTEHWKLECSRRWYGQLHCMMGDMNFKERENWQNRGIGNVVMEKYEEN